MCTVEHYLGIYRVRCAMQRDGVTDPRPEVKQFCLDLVRALEQLDPAAGVELVCRGADGTDFVSDGKVLATCPADEDPRWHGGNTSA